MKRLAGEISKHGRFYSALICGAAAYGIASALKQQAPLLAAGDAFYLVFLTLIAVMVAGQSPADLKKRAKTEDEGIVIVFLVTLATIVYFVAAVFIALNKKHGIDPLSLGLALAGAPLGWLTLQAIMAFHYADVHYFDDPSCADDEGDLQFPGDRGDPGPWDFLYYAFVVGMTCQVSDVQVLTTPMRRLTLLHGVVSFFFNTVFIAMAVNAGVALAS
jgi:uncharacterized membrane protein